LLALARLALTMGLTGEKGGCGGMGSCTYNAATTILILKWLVVGKGFQKTQGPHKAFNSMQVIKRKGPLKKALKGLEVIEKAFDLSLQGKGNLIENQEKSYPN